MVDWQGRVAWIVGASSGIGRATAHELHARGAFVVVSARDAAALDAFCLEHPGSLALPLDVVDACAVQKSMEHLLGHFGALDLALYCAGHWSPLRATHFDLAQMIRHQQVNYLGALHVLAAVLPRMLAVQAGHLSFVGSVAGYRGLPTALAYGPTKAALQNLAEILYLDLHRRGLGVSIVNPGFVATPLTARNAFPMPAIITSQEAAARILAGWKRGSFEIHFPKRFTLLLKLLALLPNRWYFAALGRVPDEGRAHGGAG
jgi:NAD(P)-dependent dehydrogenase (short-subunit alcohol dehydrogenase family)